MMITGCKMSLAIKWQKWHKQNIFVHKLKMTEEMSVLLELTLFTCHCWTKHRCHMQSLSDDSPNHKTHLGGGLTTAEPRVTEEPEVKGELGCK